MRPAALDAASPVDAALALATVVASLGTAALVRAKGRHALGWLGEFKVARALDRAGLRHVDDVRLPTRTGSTQIDHLVRAGGAIVVVETKNLSGRVVGRADQRRWTLLTGIGTKAHSFQNPVDQNAGHVRAVRAVVGSSVAVEGRVAFVGKARFDAGVPDYVVSSAGLIPELERIAATRPETWESGLAWGRLVDATRSEAVRTLMTEHGRGVRSPPDRGKPVRRLR